MAVLNDTTEVPRDQRLHALFMCISLEMNTQGVRGVSAQS